MSKIEAGNTHGGKMREEKDRTSRQSTPKNGEERKSKKDGKRILIFFVLIYFPRCFV